MKRKTTKYDLFHSHKRGNADVEARLYEMIRTMETPNNLKKLGEVLWGNPNKSKFEKPNLNFSKIKAALDQFKLDDSKTE
jgi:hypothetical protein